MTPEQLAALGEVMGTFAFLRWVVAFAFAIGLIIFGAAKP
jgi:hypothetical protein